MGLAGWQSVVVEVLAADHHLIGRGPSSFWRSIRFTLPNLLLEPPSPHIFAALVSLPPPPLAASSSPLLSLATVALHHRPPAAASSSASRRESFHRASSLPLSPLSSFFLGSSLRCLSGSSSSGWSVALASGSISISIGCIFGVNSILDLVLFAAGRFLVVLGLKLDVFSLARFAVVLSHSPPAAAAAA
ncbi:hypothetical protein NW759_011882 [Fusarium solani]|uniref:Uncharacterized protein n=1 Tax=Fusarium solani TaxID=169388 RepID=A0A9P9KQD7_FUSSL|nr:uncharacterized protein B0J15DRAFT_252639 [Fusarium solani]KAH7266577.1 hypothetical protein B0J15DRAFT_252639 [Fusarium solani]KAJ4212190.1 hypothetical protein NW759_011882 [Fusarium solani]